MVQNSNVCPGIGKTARKFPSEARAVKTDELQRIAIEAGQMAYTTRQDMLDAGYEQEARAWERLSDAADALHAMRMRKRAYPPSGQVPPHGPTL